MALNVGARIGPYEILQFSGAGGMGQVYRARDTRLNRDVAVKILPEAFLHDQDPLARFRREAQVLAALNHPNIAAIHGLEESDGLRALVMEFVEGRTLADLIAESGTTNSGRATVGLSLPEVLSIARQIAEALEAAHDQGIIHRDLKPANIMVRHDGTVKVLDFGLAKALDPVTSAAGLAAGALENSPTLTSPAVTHRGVILGTAAYMSPEQARGKAADKRTDIWAFGVVLYEMVTGRRLFQGEHVTDVLAAVVKDAPDLTAAPPVVRRLLEKCLEKDPRKRLRDISSVALLLDAAETAPSAAHAAQKGWPPKAVAAVVALGVVAAASAIALALAVSRRTAPAPHAIEFSMEAPPGTSFANIHSGSAVSPDGRHIVFSAGASGGPASLWLRRLGTIDAQLLAGTEGASAPVWSPDGRSIAFMAEKKLKRLDLAGGPAVTLADVPRADPNHPGAWSRDGTILFGCSCGLDSVSSSGGAVTTLRKVDAGIKETAYGAPQFLPNGNRFIYFVASTDPKVQGVYASSLADPSQRTLVLNTIGKAVYAPPRGGGPGHLLWMENQTLQARPFDSDSLQWRGDPVSLAEGVALAGTTSVRAAFWTSEAGLLLYVRGGNAEPKFPLVWYGSDGRPLGEAAPEGPYNAIAISRDQQHVALTRQGIPRTAEPNGDIWLWDFTRQTNARITFGPTADENPAWSPDGKQLAFSSDRDGFFQLYRKDASGAGEEERLTNEPKRHQDPLHWSPDGRYLVYRQLNPGTGWDLMLLPLQGDRKPIVLLQTPESDSDARFSPDGRWIAYHSRLNGRSLEVYIQGFSGDGKVGLIGTRLQISNGGAVAPLWRGDGKEVYYQTMLGGKVMAAALQFVPQLQAARPRELFTIDLLEGRLHSLDVTADGKKFLAVLNPRQKPQPPRLTVVTDWQARLGN